MDAPRPVPIFGARVVGGAIKPTEAGRWAGYLARLEGRDVDVLVRPQRKHRSLNANRYYFGVVVAAAAEWSGHEPEEIHEVWKGMFLPLVRFKLPNGQEVERTGSTVDLSTEAFAEYVNRCIRWLSEAGVLVPSSEEVA